MIKDKIPYAIEGILFAAGEPVKSAKLAAVLETDIETVEEAVKLLKYSYQVYIKQILLILVQK